MVAKTTNGLVTIVLPDAGDCRLPVFTIQQATSFVRDSFGIDGTLTPLDGERDLNYLVQSREASTEKYVFKICNVQECTDLLAAQSVAMEMVSEHSRFDCTRPVLSNNGGVVEQIVSDSGSIHFCRLTTWLEGDLLSTVSPRSDHLLETVGEVVAEFSLAVQDIKTDALERPLLWQMENAVDVVEQFEALIAERERRVILAGAKQLFVNEVVTRRSVLLRGVIHNDANDNNIVINDAGPWQQDVIGLIDFGDMVYCWLVTDLAVACTYAMLDADKPLDVAVSVIRGYHKIRPLDEEEIAALFPMIQMRLAMSVSICAQQKRLEPDNHYLTVSERPAWQLLQQLGKLSPRYCEYLFRQACGFSAVPAQQAIVSLLRQQHAFSPVCELPESVSQLLLLDNSVSSPYLDSTSNKSGDGYDCGRMSRELDRAMEDAGATAAIGRYDEYRLIYQSDDFTDATGHQRTLHLGIDIFQPAGSAVYCPVDGIVHSIANNDSPFDYGGTIILRHDITDEHDDEQVFYTLYGHLAPDSFSCLVPGARVNAGEKIGAMGRPCENGNWPPHVHFQIILDMLGQQGTFVGVGSHGHRDLWLSICPDPNLILRLSPEFLAQPLSDSIREPDEINASRSRYIPSTLSLSYLQPVSMARGAGQYLYDYTGRQFLDAVNNVPHVGHCHPDVVAAATNANRVLNTNTRYLYRGLGEYAERLLAKCPESLSKVFFVNSGSEANDLALRMAYCHSGRSQVVALEHGYHGNLGALIDISSYKHDGPGGQGAPGWVHTVAVPDLYRSSLSVDSDGERYAKPVSDLLADIAISSKVAAFISEAIPGCGGQLMLPQGYLAEVYRLIRLAGGLCIADEVQTGFGRVGSHFWAFETHNVVPDILTIGKPAGNGHPIGAVVTTEEVAQSFTNGMEYFNTFGGNPVSCAIGLAVLDVMERQQLQEHARSSGEHLLDQLQRLATQFPVIGDVRGAGLFLGVELVESHDTLKPAASQASYIAERMKQEGVLLSTDGPCHNVLKIKPPLVFDFQDGDRLIGVLESILTERWAQPDAACIGS